MTHRVVHRPTRITEPTTAAETTTLSPPPAMTDGQVGGQALHTLLPVLGALSSVTMIVVLRNSNPLFLVMGAVLLVVALVGGVGFAFSQRGQAARGRRTQRELYLDYLERLRAEMRDKARGVRERAANLDPEPAALLELVRDPARLWERRRSHADFLRVRAGVGDVSWFDLKVPPAENPVRPHDPIMLAEVEALAEHYSAVMGVPVTLGLDGAGQVALIGNRADVLGAARAMILQLASLHSPDDLLLAAVFDDERAADWQGFDLLPHVVDPKLFDAGVPARRVASSIPELVRVLGGELADRAQLAAMSKRSVGTSSAPPNSRLVVFCDDYGRLASTLPVPDADLELADLQITAVHLLSDRLHEPSDVRIRLTVTEPGRAPRITTDRAEPARAVVSDSRRVGEEEKPRPPQNVSLDRPSADVFNAVARSLTPLRLSLSAGEQTESADGIEITQLLGIDRLAQVGPELWRTRSSRDFLRVPIGVDDYGAPILLDLKESAELGMGPHGICIGATGSGKSEMLRTLVLALALSHPPEDLSMVLVDYKGGAAFAPFAGLPHVAGIIDNLADDPQLTARARSSIAGEVVRRQEMLRDAGASPSISHYRALRNERIRTGGPELPPMPHLFVVIDEFGELLTAEPDFVDLLIQIGRIGRSIGVHLLLSSQRIEAGKLRGLDTYLSYRIGLRTFSESESNVVLDTKDAFHLPAIPGYGYLKVDTSIYRRFRSGYVSGPAAEAERDPGELEQTEHVEPLLLPVYNTLQRAKAGAEDDREMELTEPTVGRPLVEECVDRLQNGTSDRAVSPVWLPPLPERLPLARVIPDELKTTDEPKAPGADTRRGGLRVPIGLLDAPAKQRQQPWLLDLTRAGGHVAIIGAPGSGRSTFLRTMAASLSLTHTPRQVSVYGMDLTGGGLRRIEGFPHVGGVATRANPDQLLRLLEELAGMLTVREAVFRDRGIDSLAMLRGQHAVGRIPELLSAEVVLMVDGVSQLRTEFEELEERLFDLLQRGGSFGIHVILALTRWNDIRMTQQPMIGTRFELRLNDPSDSSIGRKLNAVLKADQPGRVLTDESLFGQIALPVLDDVSDDDVGNALEELASRSAASWEGPAAAPIRLLPARLDPELLPDALDEPDAVPFGLRQDTMEAALLELDGPDQHLLVFGDSGSGKTTLLRTVIRGLLDRYTADELVIAVMDLRGDVAEEVPDAYLGGHASTSGLARGLATAIAAELEGRLSAAGGSGDQDGGGRSSARPKVAAGPRIVVLADDFDILASGGNEPLAPLLPFLPSARDLKLHVLLTRPVAGVGRAMFDVGMQTLRDTGGTVLLMSGERGEGQIVPGVFAEQMLPGRGQLIRRGEPRRIVQVANTQPGPVEQPAERGGSPNAA